MEEKTQRQGGFNREVRVLPLRAPRARSVRFPGGDGRRGQPDGDVASSGQGAIIEGPVLNAGTSSCRWDGLSSFLHPVWSMKHRWLGTVACQFRFVHHRVCRESPVKGDKMT